MKPTTYYILMNNIFNSPIYYDPVEIYDLKGSTVGRFVPDSKKDSVTTLKVFGFWSVLSGVNGFFF